MKSILQEIREQPPHIREVFMWVSVVITFSIIGFAWFRSTTKQFAALLNPKQTQAAGVLAKAENESSPFGAITALLKDLQANIGELFNLVGKPNNFEVNGEAEIRKNIIEPQILPLSGNKK